MRKLVWLVGYLVGCDAVPAADAKDFGAEDLSANDLASSVDLKAPASGDLALDHPDVGPPPSTDPIEPMWPTVGVAARVKSPAQRMHFTAGLPFRMLADHDDDNEWMCPPGHPPYVCTDTSMTFFIDGQEVGTLPPNPDNQDLWDLRLASGLSQGDHVLTVRYTPHGGAAAVDGLIPVYIHADALPAHANQVSLAADMVLSGSGDLDWSDTLVQGNGHKVTAAAGYSGKIHIQNSFVTGLADYSALGIDVTTTGSVDISQSIFEATAPLHVVVNGSGGVSFINNEFRSTNYVTFVSSDPSATPILDLSGSTSGAKIFQGNLIGSGIVNVSNMAGWQIGGLHDHESNILIGPRCVLNLTGSAQAVIQGNYLHHDYYGGFSQGFNLSMSGIGDALVEHNVIRGGSWPVQTFGGELRYNLLVDSGHDFMRSAADGARIHHNLFVHTQEANSGYNGAIFLYSGEQNLVFDNNTLDVGGNPGGFDSPFIVLQNPGILVSSIRNNVFSLAAGDNDLWPSKSFVSGGGSEASIAAPRVTTADYNAWYNPLATQTTAYQAGIVANPPGAHDVNGDPLFAGTVPQAPYEIDEGMVWTRQYGVSQTLAYYRALYTPRNQSPLVDKGDPADGAGNDIGAVGAGAANANDLFGLVVQAN